MTKKRSVEMTKKRVVEMSFFCGHGRECVIVLLIKGGLALSGQIVPNQMHPVFGLHGWIGISELRRSRGDRSWVIGAVIPKYLSQRLACARPVAYKMYLKTEIRVSQYVDLRLTECKGTTLFWFHQIMLFSCFHVFTFSHFEFWFLSSRAENRI